jgi:hypothetical protein
MTVVISPNIKKTSVRIDPSGNIINPRTKEITQPVEAEYVPPTQPIQPTPIPDDSPVKGNPPSKIDDMISKKIEEIINKKIEEALSKL